MKTRKIVAILAGIMLVAFGVGLLSLRYYGFDEKVFNNINWKFGFPLNKLVRTSNNNSNYIEKNIDEEKIENAAGINTIDIDVSFSNINIIPENRDDIKIHYHGYIKARFIPDLKTKCSNKTLYIYHEKGLSGSNSTETIDVKLDIYIPETYKNNIKADTSFGSINISNLNLSKLKAITSFGDIEISDLTGNVEADTSYGNITVKNLSGNLEASTSFGGIELEYEEFDYNINADTSFGNIELTLPRDSQFKIDAECSFGRIDIDFPLTITKNEDDELSGTVGSGRNKIKLESSSGDIKVISK